MKKPNTTKSSARSTPTARESHKLAKLAERVRELPRDRQAALRDDLGVRALFDDAGVKLVPLSAVATAYGLSTRTLLRHVDRGELEVLKIGRGFQVSREQLTAWLARRTVSRAS